MCRQPGSQSGNGPDEAAEHNRAGQNLAGRPQQPEKSSHHLDEETKRRREEDHVNEGDVEGDEL
ncbi:hypothetical protein ACFWSF_21690 [Streptomyces sp. NPDC058611]|uniref:hypothetical protein n=1 Tax=unclassified Streptomyces TaxID=2593676 RepID=UPI0036681675